MIYYKIFAFESKNLYRITLKGKMYLLFSSGWKVWNNDLTGLVAITKQEAKNKAKESGLNLLGRPL